MTESIYNNAGMPSEQKAAPTMPEDLRRELAHLNFLIEESCTGQATSMTRSWANRIAALTLERDTLKAELESVKHGSGWWEVTPAGQKKRCSVNDEEELRIACEEVAALKAKVERLSAPVSDEDGWLIERGGLCIGMECNTAAWVTFTHPQAIRFSREQDAENMLTSLRSFGHGKAFHDCIVTGHTWVAARASTPPPRPINDDEQRRKDAAWNDRPKARCVCGEMIAWYSGEYLHVASRSKSCADGRLASPAHFLVGMPPAEPEWEKGA